MKVDLDELERRAQLAVTSPYAIDEWERDNLVHQPQFTLALIARIRRLEGLLVDVADDLRVSGGWPVTEAQIRELLEKGTTTP